MQITNQIVAVGDTIRQTRISDRYQMGVNTKNVRTVIDKCGETTEIVESYFYTIKIDVDRKARTTLKE
jgi:hypothetical protein